MAPRKKNPRRENQALKYDAIKAQSCYYLTVICWPLLIQANQVISSAVINDAEGKQDRRLSVGEKATRQTTIIKTSNNIFSARFAETISPTDQVCEM